MVAFHWLIFGTQIQLSFLPLAVEVTKFFEAEGVGRGVPFQMLEIGKNKKKTNVAIAFWALFKFGLY